MWSAIGRILTKVLSWVLLFLGGRASAHAGQTKEAFKAERNRREIDGEIGRLSDADLRDKLWNDPAMRRGEPD